MDFKLVKQLPGTLYSAVVMELFERLAYYGMVLVLGIYIVDNLGVPADVYGWVYGFFTGLCTCCRWWPGRWRTGLATSRRWWSRSPP